MLVKVLIMEILFTAITRHCFDITSLLMIVKFLIWIISITIFTKHLPVDAIINMISIKFTLYALFALMVRAQYFLKLAFLLMFIEILIIELFRTAIRGIYAGNHIFGKCYKSELWNPWNKLVIITFRTFFSVSQMGTLLAEEGVAFFTGIWPID